MTDPQQQALPPIPAKFPGVWVPEAGAFIDISIHLREAIENRDDEWRALAASAPSREVPPRPFTAVKSFADAVLSMLDERIKVAERASHPFMDKFGDHPETIVAAEAQATELRDVRYQVRVLGDRALTQLSKLKVTPSSPSVAAEETKP